MEKHSHGNGVYFMEQPWQTQACDQGINTTQGLPVAPGMAFTIGLIPFLPRPSRPAFQLISSHLRLQGTLCPHQKLRLPPFPLVLVNVTLFVDRLFRDVLELWEALGG